ncbi:uncharacterized protein LOC129581046 [Paramacrobiotus metropolitanus]|uniref:uncharacterized protein LOC129581046 n=1 Tax=Paramacrobiotus metropolitanus TaxID=2943436 RepID=UPI00244641E3|nr:uncharacterized protein LOC129581046 [Paramacrobiotus metropolitanus]
MFDGNPIENGRRFQMSLAVLTLDVTAELLALLDVHSLARARRVCSLWDTLANAKGFSSIIIIDFNHICTERMIRWDTKGYCTGFVLNQNIKGHTKVLVLLNMIEEHEMSAMENVISSFLIVKRKRLSTIVVKNYYRKVCLPFSAGLQSTPITMWLARRCRILILLNFSVTIPNSTRPYYFYKMPGYRQADDSVRLLITIPFIKIDGVHDDIKNIVRRFKAALNEHCPILDDVIADKLKQLYANWIRTVPQTPPNDVCWGGFKSYLALFDCNDTPDSVWVNFDPSNFDERLFGNVPKAIMARDYLGWSPSGQAPCLLDCQ